MKDNTPEPALAAALADKDPARRAVAAEALGRAAGKQPGAAPRAARALLKDADVQVRRRAAFGLLAAKDREAVPVLDQPAGRAAGQANLAHRGSPLRPGRRQPPVFNSPRTDEVKYRDTWAGSGGKTTRRRSTSPKLGTPRPYLGYTLLSHTDFREGGPGRQSVRTRRCRQVALGTR